MHLHPCHHVQVAFNRSLLPRTLAALPGGGLVHGSIVEVSDQEQQFKAQLVISHRVRGVGPALEAHGLHVTRSPCHQMLAQQPAAPGSCTPEKHPPNFCLRCANPTAGRVG